MEHVVDMEAFRRYRSRAGKRSERALNDIEDWWPIIAVEAEAATGAERAAYEEILAGIEQLSAARAALKAESMARHPSRSI